MIVAFSGHRPEKLGGYGIYNPMRDRLIARLEQRLLELRAEHSNLTCISGMALGWDQWAAHACVRLGIPFNAAVPFAGQESRWPTTSQEMYRALLADAAHVHIVSPGGFSSKKMQIRNEWMVDRCELLLLAWDRSPGGTGNCVRYALKVGRKMENLL